MKNIILLCIALFILQNLQAQTPPDSAAIEDLKAKSWSFLNGHPDSVLFYASKGLALATKLDNKKAQGDFYYRLCIGHYSQGNEQQAIALADTVEQIGITIKDTTLLLASYAMKGLIFKQLDKYEQAIEQQLKSLKMAQASGNKNGEATAYTNIAQLYNNLSNTSQSLAYYQKARKLFEQMNDTVRIVHVYIGLGNHFYYRSSNENAAHYLDSALYYFNKVLQMRSYAEGVDIISAKLYNNLGNVYRDKQQYNKANIFYKKAYEQFVMLKDPRSELNVLAMLGKSYINTNQPDSARLYTEKGLSLIKNDTLYKEIYRLLYSNMNRIEYAAGNYKQAHKWLEKESILDRELAEQLNSERLKELTIKYETDLKEQNNQLLTKENEVLVYKDKASLRLRNELFAVIGALLLVLALAAYVIYLRKNKLAQQNLLLVSEQERAEEERVKTSCLRSRCS